MIPYPLGTARHDRSRVRVIGFQDNLDSFVEPLYQGIWADLMKGLARLGNPHSGFSVAG